MLSDTYRPYKGTMGAVFCGQAPLDPREPVKAPEKLLRCLWFDRKFTQPLKALDGRKVTILSPGWWNSGPGPDFLNAVYRDEKGRTFKGNVEIHVRKNDWNRHGHGGDKNYRDLGLHVFFKNDGKKGKAVSNGIQIELAPFLITDIEELGKKIDPNSYPLCSKSALGNCCPAIKKLEQGLVEDILDSAGESRMREKGKRLLTRLGEGGFEQVWYEGVMEALGYKNNSAPFLELARKLSIRTLINSVEGLSRDEATLLLQGILLSASGFLAAPHEAGGHGHSGEAGEYLQRIEQVDRRAAVNMFTGILKKEDWVFTGLRPSNYPQARLAGAAILIERFRRENPFLFFLDRVSAWDPVIPSSQARGFIKGITQALVVDEPKNFWSRRHKLEGAKALKPRKLIGPDRASVVLVNIVLPSLLAYSMETGNRGLEEKVFQLYFKHPPLPGNSVQKFMNAFLLGEGFKRSPQVNSAKRQQGLIHIYNLFCAANETGCVGCDFLKEINGLAAFTGGGIGVMPTKYTKGHEKELK